MEELIPEGRSERGCGGSKYEHKVHFPVLTGGGMGMQKKTVERDDGGPWLL